MTKICDICGKPRGDINSGSLTQWVFNPQSCSCVVGRDENPAPEIAVCSLCGKFVREGRSGSFTQWVFRQDQCACAKPVIVHKSSRSSGQTGAANHQFDAGPKVEAELSLDKSSFPSDRYKPLEELGRGAAGFVYLCRDKLLGVKVAVKCLRMVSAQEVMSFQTEARIITKLDHRNIVKVLNFDVTESGAPFMVMEYIEGISLQEWLESKGRLTVDQVLFIFGKICDALQFAHSKGVFHRDLKCSNILLIGSKEASIVDVRLIDFGVSVIMNQESTIVQGLTFVGTPAYMPPDQARGHKYDARSEIYSLGCVMFEALAGRPPFQGATALETIGMHANSAPPAVSELIAESLDVPELENILSRCLEKNMDARFQSMEDLAAALAALHAPVQWTEPEEKPELKDRYPITPTSASKWPVGPTSIAILVFAACASFLLLIMKNMDEKPIQTSAPKVEEYQGPTAAADTTTWTPMPYADGITWLKKFNVTDEDLREGATNRLRFAYVSLWQEEEFTTRGLTYLKDASPKGIMLDDSGITDSGIKTISTFKGLEALSLHLNPQLSDNSLKPIALMKSLKILDLGENKFSDKALEYLEPLDNLEVLNLRRLPNLTGTGFKHIIGKKKLRKLILDGSNIEPENLKSLSHLRSLRILYLNCPSIGDSSIKEILSFPITALDISYSGISSFGVERLVQSKTLRKLYIGSARWVPRYANAWAPPRRIIGGLHSPIDD